MYRVRLLLLWLVMFALPVQGFAAASMLLCGGVAPSGKAVVVAVAAPHDHKQHSRAPTAGKMVKADPGASAQLPDSQHTCGVCAACCHIVAIAQWPHVVAVGTPPQADLTEPSVRVEVTPSQVPEKPPRA